MDADDGTDRTVTPPAAAGEAFSLRFLHAQAQQEAKREMREAAKRRAVEKARKSAQEKKRSRKKALAAARKYQSSRQERMPSEEQVPAMFDKLDSEVVSVGACSTGKMAEVDIHQPLEHGISSEIHQTSEEKDSITAEMHARSPEEKLTDWLSKLFEQLESRNSTGKLAQVEIYPLVEEEVVSSETHTSLMGKDSIMAEVDAGLHEEEELPDWMSQLFEKLDMEMNEDSICCMEKVANAERRPLLEHGISSEIHRTSKGEASVMFEKFDIEMNEDSGYSTGKLSPTETHPVVEHGISSEINRSSTGEGPVTAKVDIDGSDDEDEFDDWMLKMMKMGANDDMSYLYNVDQEEKHPVHCDQLGDYDLMDEVEDYPKNMKKFSYRKAIENGFKWMSEECFLAFTKYAENLNFEGIEHRFGEIRHQCFNVEAHGKTFHHFNFTIETKDKSDNTWISVLYFAEVKQEFGTKSYFCHRLEPSEKGRCNGCKSQNVSELLHPSGGGYQEGCADIYWPFDVDTDRESDTSDV